MKKELMEVLQAAEDLAFVAGQVEKDGKVDYTDAQYLMGLAPKVGDFTAAADNIKGIAEEIKSWPVEDLQAVVMKVVGLKTAFENGKNS